MVKLKHYKLIVFFCFIFFIFFALAIIYFFTINFYDGFRFLGGEEIIITDDYLFKSKIAVFLMRLFVYLLPCSSVFVLWAIYEHMKKAYISFKSRIRVYFYFLTLQMFSYLLFSTLYYISCAQYWSLLETDPFSNSSKVAFLATIVFSLIMNKIVIHTDDSKITSLIFEKKLINKDDSTY